jgi:hypothetical protein
MTFNLDEILAVIGSTGESPPFWSFDPKIKDQPFRTHLLVKTNDSVEFLNRGYTFARNQTNDEVIIENGIPKMMAFPPPYESGYKEAELRILDKRELGEKNIIPNVAELSYFLPVADKNPRGALQLRKLYRFLIEVESVDLAPIDDSKFSPSWTNALSVVVTAGDSNQPFAFITKEKTYNAALRKGEKFRRIPMERATRAGPWTTAILISIVAGPPLIWLLFRRTLKKESAADRK